jgi:hypothetical protein
MENFQKDETFQGLLLLREIFLVEESFCGFEGNDFLGWIFLVFLVRECSKNTYVCMGGFFKFHLEDFDLFFNKIKIRSEKCKDCLIWWIDFKKFEMLWVRVPHSKLF